MLGAMHFDITSLNGPHHAKICVQNFADSEGPDQPAWMYETNSPNGLENLIMYIALYQVWGNILWPPHKHFMTANMLTKYSEVGSFWKNRRNKKTKIANLF